MEAVWRDLRLVLSGIVAGAALVVLLLGVVAKVADDELAPGCLVMGSTLMLLAGYIAVQAMVA